MDNIQLAMFDPSSDWTATPVPGLPSWKGAKRVAVDVETKDMDLEDLGPGVRRRDSYVCGVSFAIEDGPAHYLPVRHALKGNLPEETVWRYLWDQAAEFRGTIVGANLSYDLDWLAQYGVVYRRAAWFRDIQIAHPLLDEMAESYSLDATAKSVGLPGKDEELLRRAADEFGINPKSELWKLHAKHVGAYAEQDARLPLAILRRQERMIADQDLQRVFDLESRSLPVFVKMTRRGIAVDPGRLQRIADWALQVETECMAKVAYATGVKVGIDDTNKASSLVKCFQAIGVELPLTKSEKPRPSIAGEVLDAIDHEVAGLVRRARKFNKCRTTFVASMYRFITNDRVHASFAQLRRAREDGGTRGPAYGRASSYKPNVQQQYARDPELAIPWRSIFMADEGKQWASLDFSQQEPRLAVHYAVLAKCPRALEAAQRYIDDPSTDSHAVMAALMYEDFDAKWGSSDKTLKKIAKGMRTYAKQIYLGMSYGMGGAKLCRSLGLPTRWVKKTWGDREGMAEVAGDEGKEIINRFNQKVPYIKKLSKQVEKRAKKMGYIITLYGRRCRFPRKNGRFDWTHKALNRLIQGSAADQTKAVMVAADRLGFPLQVAVHDEVDLSVESRAQAEELARVMENEVILEIPSKVDVELGASWGESMAA